ncbi:MAG: AMP-binding protein [Flavobacteriales bacterium]|nr:AMP-binding protein [Flavobacteriales bacterium]
MGAPLNTLTLDGLTLSGDALVDLAIALRIDREDAEWTCSFQRLIDELITSDGPLIAHTSGTTGPPKRIVLDRVDLLASAHLTGKTFGLTKGDRALLCLPCGFIAGKMMVVRAMVLGLDLHVIDPRGSILDHLDREEHFRFTAMVPHQLQRALEEDPERVNAQFNTILLGGGPVGSMLLDLVNTIGTKVFQSYGSTETLTHVALRALNGPDRSDAFRALGPVNFGLDVRGCLVIYTPHLSTSQHITNDLVELIDTTHFRWLGRVDNVILSGGKKVFPEQLEARTATVLPYPHYFTATADERLGQAVVLVLETENTAKEVMSDIMTALMQVLEKHELPRHVRTVPGFIRTESGKLVRRN